MRKSDGKAAGGPARRGGGERYEGMFHAPVRRGSPGGLTLIATREVGDDRDD